MSGTISPRDRLQLWVNTFLLKQKENSGSVTATFRDEYLGGSDFMRIVIVLKFWARLPSKSARLYWDLGSVQDFLRGLTLSQPKQVDKFEG